MEYYILAEASGEARGILETLKKNLNFEKKFLKKQKEKKSNVTPRVTMGSLNKCQPIWSSSLANYS